MVTSQRVVYHLPAELLAPWVNALQLGQLTTW